MNKTLIINEIKSSIKGYIIFSLLTLSALIALILLHPIIDDEMISKIIGLNKYVKKIFYLNDNILEHNEYYAFTMQYVIILGSFMAVFMATKQILWDRKVCYDEYLFTLPISRGKIFLNKCICLLIELLFFNIIFYVVSITLSYMAYKVSLKYIILMNTALILAQLTFAAIGLLVGSLIRNPRLIYLKSNTAVVFFLILGAIERMFNIAILKYINPFSYLAVRDLLLGSYKYSFLIASGFIMVFSITISKSMYDEYDT